MLLPLGEIKSGDDDDAAISDEIFSVLHPVKSQASCEKEKCSSAACTRHIIFILPRLPYSRTYKPIIIMGVFEAWKKQLIFF